MGRLRLLGGSAVGTLLPPIVTGAAAGLSSYVADLKSWAAVAVVTGAAGAGPPLLSRLGRIISGPSARDRALGTVLSMLVEELLRSGTPPDAVTPAIRATAFVPSKHAKEHVLVPHLRVTSRSANVVERSGREFRSNAYFRKGDSYVGQVWEASTKEVYKICKAEVDFANEASDDRTRIAMWSAQFDSKLTERWSDHMRKVRTIWVFSIPKIDGRDSDTNTADTADTTAAPKVVAVISVDATQGDAFSSPAVDGNCMLKMDARQATATTAVGMFHSLANRKKRLHGIFKR